MMYPSLTLPPSLPPSLSPSLPLSWPWLYAQWFHRTSCVVTLAPREWFHEERLGGVEHHCGLYRRQSCWKGTEMTKVTAYVAASWWIRPEESQPYVTGMNINIDFSVFSLLRNKSAKGCVTQFDATHFILENFIFSPVCRMCYFQFMHKKKLFFVYIYSRNLLCLCCCFFDKYG